MTHLLHELLSKRSWKSFSIICPLNQNYLFRRKFWKNIYRRVYFSQFIDWTGVLVWNDAVITPSESEFAIGSEATWIQSIFVKLGADKVKTFGNSWNSTQLENLIYRELVPWYPNSVRGVPSWKAGARWWGGPTPSMWGLRSEDGPVLRTLGYCLRYYDDRV